MKVCMDGSEAGGKPEEEHLVSLTVDYVFHPNKVCSVPLSHGVIVNKPTLTKNRILLRSIKGFQQKPLHLCRRALSPITHQADREQQKTFWPLDKYILI